MLYVRNHHTWLEVPEYVVEENEEFLVGPKSNLRNLELVFESPESYERRISCGRISRLTGLPLEKIQNYMPGTILQENGEPYKGATGF